MYKKVPGYFFRPGTFFTQEETNYFLLLSNTSDILPATLMTLPMIDQVFDVGTTRLSTSYKPAATVIAIETVPMITCVFCGFSDNP